MTNELKQVPRPNVQVAPVASSAYRIANVIRNGTPDVIGHFQIILSWTAEPRPVATERATVDEFLAWLSSEDFGDDPHRLRRQAWNN